MEKTLKQIADELGVDKQRVYRFVKKNRITEAHQKNGVKHYDEAAQNQILSHFRQIKQEVTVSEQTLSSASFDVLLKQSEMLKNELEIKNRQIEGLNARLAETTAALMAAQQEVHEAHTLHAGTIQQLTAGSPTAEAGQELEQLRKERDTAIAERDEARKGEQWQKGTIEDYADKIEKRNEKIGQLEDEIERLKGRSLWQRLFNRD